MDIIKTQQPVGDGLSNYKNSIKYGIYLLVEEKYENYKDADLLWMEKWNKTLNDYNGGNRPAYVQEVRVFEKNFLPQIKEGIQ